MIQKLSDTSNVETRILNPNYQLNHKTDKTIISTQLTTQYLFK
jgi:hypothetical protein